MERRNVRSLELLKDFCKYFSASKILSSNTTIDLDSMMKLFSGQSFQLLYESIMSLLVSIIISSPAALLTLEMKLLGLRRKGNKGYLAIGQKTWKCTVSFTTLHHPLP